MNLAGFLIAIAPLLALVGMLLARRYPGERAIEKLRGLLSAVLAPVTASGLAAGLVPDFDTTVRGGRLIACFLAGRAPPGPA